MLKGRIIKLSLAAAAIVAAAGITGLGATAASAATPAHARAASTVAAPAVPPTSNRCLNKVHTIPCWALTKYATTLYLSNGKRVRIGGNDVVLLQCYYFIDGTVDDHVTGGEQRTPARHRPHRGLGYRARWQPMAPAQQIQPPALRLRS